MFTSIKRVWHSIRRGQAGSRFQDHYERTKERSQPKYRGWFIALGIVLMIAGLLLSIPPGIPGFIVTLVGAAVISSRSRWAAKKFDHLEHRTHRLIRTVLRK